MNETEVRDEQDDEEEAPKKARRRPYKRRKVKAAASQPEAPKSDSSEFMLRVQLQGRHFEWLKAVGRMEGRTPEQMAERIIRLACAADPTKGGRYTANMGGGSVNGAAGVTSQHPARGSE